MARLVSLMTGDQTLIGDRAMHAGAVLQKLLIQFVPDLHQKRASALLAGVVSALERHRLTLCELARGFPATCSVRHRIKRSDRLLGNRDLHGRRPILYQMLCRLLIGGCRQPIIIVDWSDLKPDRSWLLLRATVWTHGFALPVYEEVHPLRLQASPRVERAFLLTLKRLLGDSVRPIIVTDAGFRGPWFKQVESMGWHWVGRIRGRTFIEYASGRWKHCRAFYAQATGKPQDLGRHRLIKSRPVSGRLCLYRKTPKGRSAQTHTGRRARNSHSEKCAAREREPWLLAASCSLDGQTTPLDIVNLYRTRMRIEQSFRTLKSHQFGFSFKDSQSDGAPRLQMLLLIHALALFLLWIAGRIADQQSLRPQYESNARRSRTTISIITLGWLALSEQAIRFTYDGFIRACQAPPPLLPEHPASRPRKPRI